MSEAGLIVNDAGSPVRQAIRTRDAACLGTGDGTHQSGRSIRRHLTMWRCYQVPRHRAVEVARGERGGV